MCAALNAGGNAKAAIWWRVSTDVQRDISPITQQKEALQLAQQEGYTVPEEFVLGTAWHSLSVWNSPPMEHLKDLIRTHAIQAVYVFHPDRLPSKPAHRMMLRALCEEHRVQVRCAQGQLPEGEFGEVMEFLDSWAKEKQVKRTQDASKRGLRDRVLEKGLPANGKMPYGYRLRYTIDHDKKIPVAAEPDGERHIIAQRIWSLALQGAPLRAICRSLVDDGIPAPQGGIIWAPVTVLRLLRNPLYAGRYYSKRSERLSGKNRLGQPSRIAKNSERRTPQEDWVFLEHFPVENQIVSWEQWEAVQAKLQSNQKWSKRNAHDVYLLAGIVVCGACGWKLSAAKRSDRNNHYYRCQKRMGEAIGMAKCGTLPLNGKKADQKVWNAVFSFLTDTHTFLAEMEKRQGSSAKQEEVIRDNIRLLEGKANKVINMETELTLKNVRGDVSDEVYRRAVALLQAERTHYTEEIERQHLALAAKIEAKESLNTLAALRDRMMDRLNSAMPEDKRWILQALGARVVVSASELEVSIGSGTPLKSEFYVTNTDVA